LFVVSLGYWKEAVSVAKTTVMQPIVYLTCEIKGRDLDSRNLIAAHLVKLGYSVVVGECWNLKDNIATAPKGCYHFKTANRIQGNWLLFAKLNGHRTVVSDEEVLGSSEALAATTTDEQAILECDLFLAVHSAHRRALVKRWPDMAMKVKIGGTARADLLRTIDYPRPYERPYVLFNTSFGLLNSLWGSRDKVVQVYSDAMRWDLQHPEHHEIIHNRLVYEQASLKETRTLIDWFLDRDLCDVVVRPHPAENAAWWRKHYGARTYIAAATDPYPWIQHARLMIHSDSTVGIEAAIMRVPQLNLSPVDEWAERLILRQVNYTTATAEASIPAIEKFMSSGGGPIVEMAGSDPFPPDCAKTTADEMAALLPPPAPVSAFPWLATERSDVQRRKFTVSPEEFRASLTRAFELSGFTPHEVEDLTDSVVIIRPKLKVPP
jgi:surface carbohydrate biosynthesis protein